MKKHYVHFMSPGTFVSEETVIEVDHHDINDAMDKARNIKERYNAKPYCFYFTTSERKEGDFEPKTVFTSCNYYLGGKVETIEEIEKRNLPSESILLSNMKTNNWKQVITNNNSWRITVPLKDDDIILDFKNEKADWEADESKVEITEKEFNEACNRAISTPPILGMSYCEFIMNLRNELFGKQEIRKREVEK